MNILISKMDIARFGQCPDKMKTYGGFDVSALMVMNIAKAYPNHTFYYIGSNDLNDIEHPDNLIDIETAIRNYSRAHKDLEKYESAIEYCQMNDYKFDICILWYCRFTNLAYYKLNYISSKGTQRKLRQCEKTLSHIVAVAKHYELPTYYMIDDVTEIKQIPYDMPAPAAIWTQMNGETTAIHYNSLTERVKVKYPVIYKPIERLWLQGKKKVDWRNFNKTNNMIITCNAPSDQSLDKLFYINDWIFKYDTNTIIYGKWTSTKQMAQAIEELNVSDRFIQKGMTEMEDVMFNTKYTFVIPPSKRYPEFVTQKVYSMIYYGIIPFWCPNDYDKNNLYSDFPEYLKVYSPEELKTKIDELNSNQELYNSIKNKLFDLLEDKYFDLIFIKELFNDIL